MSSVLEQAKLSAKALRAMQAAQLYAADLSVAQVARDLQAAAVVERRGWGLLGFSRQQRQVLAERWPYFEDTEDPLPHSACRGIAEDIARTLTSRRAPLIVAAGQATRNAAYAVAERAYVTEQWIIDTMNASMERAAGLQEATAHHQGLQLVEELAAGALPFPDHAKLTGLYTPAWIDQAERWVDAPAPWDGKRLLDRFDDLGQFDREQIRLELLRSLTKGDGMAKAARRLRTMGDFTRRRATTIARTEIMRASHEAKGEALGLFRKDRAIGGVGILATLDDRTCELCAFYDRTEYYYSKSPRISEKPRLPIHPRCRCSEYPISGLWDKLGVSKGERWTGYRASRGVKVRTGTDFSHWLWRMEQRHAGYARRWLRKDEYLWWAKERARGSDLDVRTIYDLRFGWQAKLAKVPKQGTRAARRAAKQQATRTARLVRGRAQEDHPEIMPQMSKLKKGKYEALKERLPIPDKITSWDEANTIAKRNYGVDLSALKAKGVDVEFARPALLALDKLDERYWHLHSVTEIYARDLTGSAKACADWPSRRFTMDREWAKRKYNPRAKPLHPPMTTWSWQDAQGVWQHKRIPFTVEMASEESAYISTVVHEYGHMVHQCAAPWAKFSYYPDLSRGMAKWDAFLQSKGYGGSPFIGKIDYDRYGKLMGEKVYWTAAKKAKMPAGLEMEWQGSAAQLWFQQNVSSYSGRYPVEAFAESFVGYLDGTAPQEIVAVFEGIGL